MELMSTSFDKFYKYVYSVLDDVIPEEILGKITLAVSTSFSNHSFCMYVCKVNLEFSVHVCECPSWDALNFPGRYFVIGKGTKITSVG